MAVSFVFTHRRGRDLAIHPARLVAVGAILLALSCNARAESKHVELRLREDTPSGRLIGNLATDSGVAREVSESELPHLRYTFLNPNDLGTASLFNINSETGAVFTMAMIDRETACQTNYECMTFDVAVRSLVSSYFQIITVRVVVEDVNDNAPRFPEDRVVIPISEAAVPGSFVRTDGASDSDKGSNSVQSYSLESQDNMFNLQVDKKLDGTDDLKLILLGTLDRETKDTYYLSIAAVDGGTPQLTGTVNIVINVTDVNDNAPVFSENVYDITVRENTGINSVVGRVRATDVDRGLNAQVRYRFSPHKATNVEELFHLNAVTGDITVKSHLEYEAGGSFETIVEASDMGQPPQVSQSILILRIRDVGNNPPQVKISPVVRSSGPNFYMSEGSRQDTVVAHVQTTDRDEGPNGEVSCKSRSDFFSVHRLESRGFIVKLRRELDRETTPRLNVSLVCEDNGSPRMSTVASFKVVVEDVNDNAPVFSQEIYIANLTENNRLDDRVLRVSASDRDIHRNALLIYLLNLDDGSMFAIDHETGVIVAKSRFDRETLSQVTFTVKAMDEGEPAKTGTATVVVNILDQNDNPPQLVPPVQFDVYENMAAGSFVGRLSAVDQDIGINAEAEFLLMVDGRAHHPFEIFSDGVIRTRETIGPVAGTEYTVTVKVKDKGKPSLNSTGEVVIRVQHANEHDPVIVFPSPYNSSTQVLSDTRPGTVIANVLARDDDNGDNGKLQYTITRGDKYGIFHLEPETGQLRLARSFHPKDPLTYELTISVTDQGTPQRESRAPLHVRVVLVDAAMGTGLASANVKFIIIAAVLGGVTVIATIIVATVILHMRRSDARRRTVVSGAVQEQGDERKFEKQLWQSVPVDDISASIEHREKTIDSLLKQRMEEKKTNFNFQGPSDPDDSFPKKAAAADQFEGPHFYTFHKPPARGQGDDLHSDVSGETTTSDSGRGGSEEDIQLPPLPENADENFSCVHGAGTGGRAKDRRTLCKPHRDLTPFQTFTLRHGNPPAPAPAPGEFDMRTLGAREVIILPPDDQLLRQSVTSFRNDHSCELPLKTTSFGKKVTFKTEHLTQENLQKWNRENSHDEKGASPKKDSGARRSPGGAKVEYGPGWGVGGRPRSMDDDDNTTTSGSYTINPDELDDAVCEVYQTSVA